MIKYQKYINFYDKKKNLINQEIKETKNFYTLEEAFTHFKKEELNYIMNDKGTSIVEEIRLFQRLDNYNYRTFTKTIDINTLKIRYIGCDKI